MNNNKGSQVWGAKLTEDQVREIVRSTLPQYELAKRFKVSKGLISDIRNGKRWKHVTATTRPIMRG